MMKRIKKKEEETASHKKMNLITSLGGIYRPSCVKKKVWDSANHLSVLKYTAPPVCHIITAASEGYTAKVFLPVTEWVVINNSSSQYSANYVRNAPFIPPWPYLLEKLCRKVIPLPQLDPDTSHLWFNVHKYSQFVIKWDTSVSWKCVFKSNVTNLPIPILFNKK